MFNKILLTVDGSSHSIRATEEVHKIIKESSKAEVTVLMVVDFSDVKNEVLQGDGNVDLDIALRAKLKPIEEILKSGNISYRIEILHGTPGPEIVEYANTNQFDLLIIGSRGLNKLQEMVLGSVSHKVLKQVNCPVLVVK